jgi:predicted nuclease with TOPRIM domain
VALFNPEQQDANGNGVGDNCDALGEIAGPGDVTQEEFDALTSEVNGLQDEIASLTSRVSALEGSDSNQAAEIEALRNELDEVQERLAAVEALPGISKELAKGGGMNSVPTEATPPLRR